MAARFWSARTCPGFGR